MTPVPEIVHQFARGFVREIRPQLFVTGDRSPHLREVDVRQF
jgi:hypothetical protein